MVGGAGACSACKGWKRWDECQRLRGHGWAAEALGGREVFSMYGRLRAAAVIRGGQVFGTAAVRAQARFALQAQRGLDSPGLLCFAC